MSYDFFGQNANLTVFSNSSLFVRKKITAYLQQKKSQPISVRKLLEGFRGSVSSVFSLKMHKK
jgi:hypothetical protein